MAIRDDFSKTESEEKASFQLTLAEALLKVLPNHGKEHFLCGIPELPGSPFEEAQGEPPWMDGVRQQHSAGEMSTFSSVSDCNSSLQASPTVEDAGPVRGSCPGHAKGVPLVRGRQSGNGPLSFITLHSVQGLQSGIHPGQWYFPTSRWQ